MIYWYLQFFYIHRTSPSICSWCPNHNILRIKMIASKWKIRLKYNLDIITIILCASYVRTSLIISPLVPAWHCPCPNKLVWAPMIVVILNHCEIHNIIIDVSELLGPLNNYAINHYKVLMFTTINSLSLLTN